MWIKRRKRVSTAVDVGFFILLFRIGTCGVTSGCMWHEVSFPCMAGILLTINHPIALTMTCALSQHANAKSQNGLTYRGVVIILHADGICTCTKNLVLLLTLIGLGACCNLESLIKVPLDVINMPNKEHHQYRSPMIINPFPLTQCQPRHGSYP